LNAHMNNHTWPKAFAFLGLTVMGLALAYYSTSIATAGIAGVHFGTDPNADTFVIGTGALITGIAMAAVFAFLALTQIRGLSRKA
jgi:hypothetical protein